MRFAIKYVIMVLNDESLVSVGAILVVQFSLMICLIRALLFGLKLQKLGVRGHRIGCTILIDDRFNSHITLRCRAASVHC